MFEPQTDMIVCCDGNYKILKQLIKIKVEPFNSLCASHYTTWQSSS